MQSRDAVHWILATDVDGTLTGDRESLDRLASRLRGLRADGKLFLVFSTGRRLSQVISGVAEEGLPEPDAVICQVGTEIYLPPYRDDSRPHEAWRRRLLAQYKREEALTFLEGIEGLQIQPPEYNTELKTSCYLDACPDPERAAAQIIHRAQRASDCYQVVWSSGRDLDILPAASGKGKAIEFLIELRALPAERVIVAGDSGNDATMFQHFHRGVVVSNAQPELLQVAKQRESNSIFLASLPYASGVEQGLEYYGVFAS